MSMLKEMMSVDLNFVENNLEKDYIVNLEEFADKICGSWLSDEEIDNILLQLENQDIKYFVGEIVVKGNELMAMTNDLGLQEINLSFYCEVDNGKFAA